jgi:hypothetical protein
MHEETQKLTLAGLGKLLHTRKLSTIGTFNVSASVSIFCPRHAYCPGTNPEKYLQ